MAKKIFQYFLFCVWLAIIAICVVFICLGISDYRERLVNKQRAIDANIILTGNEITNCINEACPITGCKTAEDWEDAYFRMFGIKTACAVALYNTKPEYLKDKVPYPRHKKCYPRRDTDFFKQEGINYPELKKKYLSSTNLPEVVENNKFKIPPKLNFVWLTSEKEFKTKKEHFFKINTYMFHNTNVTPNWEHTLWTNNIDWITDEAKEKLRKHKISLRSMDEIHLENPKHKALKDLANKYATRNRWGMASDIARDLVEYYEGGVYVDGDYEILKPLELEKYMKTYRSFFGINDLRDNSIDVFEVINAFMASEPRGKVLEEKLSLTYRNTVDIMKAPDYIKYPCIEFDETLFKTGPMILTVAFDLKKGPSDALLPYCSLFSIPTSFLNCFTKIKFGKHHFHGGWATPLRHEIFIY